MNRCAVAILSALAAISVQCVLAQTYPFRTIRIVAASAPGGGSDILARMLGQKLSDEFGQQVVVDNRAGASGIIGTDLVAKAAPDGHTLLIIQPSLTINPSMFSKLPYNAIRDFAPISLVVDVPQILVMHPSVPAKTVKELIALAKARPGHITIGSAGLGTSAYVSAELFKMMAGVDMPQVVYKGGAPALIALMSGEVSVVFSTTLTAMPHIKTGRVRALGVTTLKRVQALPDVPSIAEAGVAGYEASQWFGILAPAGTPRPVIDRLYQALSRASLSPDVKERLAAEGVEVVNRTPEEFAGVIKRELQQWAKVIKAAGIQPQ